MGQFWPPLPTVQVLTGEFVSVSGDSTLVTFAVPFAAPPLVFAGSTRSGSTDTRPAIVSVTATTLRVGAQDAGGTWTAGARVMWRAEGIPA